MDPLGLLTIVIRQHILGSGQCGQRVHEGTLQQCMDEWPYHGHSKAGNPAAG